MTVAENETFPRLCAPLTSVLAQATVQDCVVQPTVAEGATLTWPTSAVPAFSPTLPVPLLQPFQDNPWFLSAWADPFYLFQS